MLFKIHSNQVLSEIVVLAAQSFYGTGKGENVPAERGKVNRLAILFR